MDKTKEKEVGKYFLLFVAIVMSIVIRHYFMPFMSGDFVIFLDKWFNQLKENGGIFALKMDLGDYNVPYIQLLAILTYFPFKSIISIKMLSIFFDYLGSIFLGILIYKMTKNKNLAMLGFALCILLPTVILNSSAWAQCDFIYVTFIILSLIFLVDDKYFISFIFLGVAFAFKLQTIFVLPVYILYYISERKFPIYYFLLIPIVDLILCLPSVIMGKPIMDILKIYFNQTGEYTEHISLNFPGVYNLFLSLVENTNEIKVQGKFWFLFGMLITGGGYLIFAMIVFLKKLKLSKKLLIELTTWSVMWCTYFLPRMHDRYMFAADVLSVACVLVDRKKWYVPVVVNLSSLYTYIFFLYHKRVVDISIVSLALWFVLFAFTVDIFIELKKENQERKDICD